MAKKLSHVASSLLEAFESAAVDLSWMGSKDPESFEKIQENYRKAAAELTEYVAGLEAFEKEKR